MCKCFEKGMKNLQVCDIAFVKLAMVAGTFWLISIFPKLTAWVVSVNHWWFLGAFILIAIKPMYSFYFKK